MAGLPYVLYGNQTIVCLIAIKVKYNTLISIKPINQFFFKQLIYRKNIENGQLRFC